MVLLTNWSRPLFGTAAVLGESGWLLKPESESASSKTSSYSSEAVSESPTKIQHLVDIQAMSCQTDSTGSFVSYFLQSAQ